MNDTTNQPLVGETTALNVATAEHLHLDTSAIDKIGRMAAASAAIRQQGDAFFALVPNDHELRDITKLIDAAAPAPRRKNGTVLLSSIESFIQFVTDQAEAHNCYIYADADTRTLTAVLNDHATLAEDPGWRDFRAVYKAELSREFACWIGMNGKQQEQEAFAIFIEDNIADIVKPSGETLMAVALTLQAKTEVDFKSHKRLDNGQIQLTYSEELTARAGGDGSIDIPREFAIGVRVFKNGDGYKIKARLKYRLSGSKVKFWYELDRPDNVIDEAFEAYVASARASGFTVLMGRP